MKRRDTLENSGDAGISGTAGSTVGGRTAVDANGQVDEITEGTVARGSAAPGEERPRYVAPGRSAILHWRMVAVFTVVCLVAGVAFGVARPPTYSAQAELYVGKTLSLENTAAIPGLAAAATQIAGDYSRLILTSTVKKEAARLVHSSDPGTLSASPIAQSPEILLKAKASTQAGAVALANAGSKALIDAVAQLNATSSSQLNGLLQQYQQLQQSINQNQQAIGALNHQIASLQANGGSSTQITDLQNELTTLQTKVSSDTLQASAVETQYQNSYAPLQAQEQVLSKLSPATPQGSDRKKTMELGGIVGLFVGLLLGVAAGSMVDIRAARRP